MLSALNSVRVDRTNNDGTPMISLSPGQMPVRDLTQEIYDFYGAFLSTVINTRSPNVSCNVVRHQNLYGNGRDSEHLQYSTRGSRGRTVANLSIGVLRFPWQLADFDKSNQLPLDQFDRRAAGVVNDPSASQKLWAVAEFVRTLYNKYGSMPRLYYYQTSDVILVTLVDDVHQIKFGFLASENV